MMLGDMIGGLRVYVVPTWVHKDGYAYIRPWRVLSKAKGRKGTRRAAKRRQKAGWRYGRWPVEPEHMMRTADAVYCTPRQYAELQRRLKAEGLV